MFSKASYTNYQLQVRSVQVLSDNLEYLIIQHLSCFRGAKLYTVYIKPINVTILNSYLSLSEKNSYRMIKFLTCYGTRSRLIGILTRLRDL